MSNPKLPVVVPSPFITIRGSGVPPGAAPVPCGSFCSWVCDSALGLKGRSSWSISQRRGLWEVHLSYLHAWVAVTLNWQLAKSSLPDRKELSLCVEDLAPGRPRRFPSWPCIHLHGHRMAWRVLWDRRPSPCSLKTCLVLLPVLGVVVRGLTVLPRPSSHSATGGCAAPLSSLLFLLISSTFGRFLQLLPLSLFLPLLLVPKVQLPLLSSSKAVTPKRNPTLTVTPRSPSPSLTNLPLVLMDVPVLDVSYKWDYVLQPFVSGFFHLD